jgi:fibronectin-binding autotransporter adhesin
MHEILRPSSSVSRLRRQLAWKCEQPRAAAALAVAAVSVTAGWTHCASAANATWNATPSSSFWNTANWSTGANAAYTPTPGDVLFFDASTSTSLGNDFAPNTLFDGINFNAAAPAYTIGGSPIRLGVVATGSITSASDIMNNSPANQAINLGINLEPGRHNLATGTGAGGLNLNGPITRSTGLNAVFSVGGGNINLGAGTGVHNDTSDAGGILGGWATIGGTAATAGNWATLDAGNNVVAYTGYTDLVGGTGSLNSGTTNNVRITTSGAAILPATVGTTSINSLLFQNGAAAAQTITMTGSTLVLGQHGGIYNATASGGGTLRNLTITGGTLTAGDGTAPAEITLSAAGLPSTAGFLTSSANIVDNGSVGTVSLTVMGGYVTLSGINTYTGGTYIHSGRVSQATANTFGTGPVYIFPGGQTNSNGTFPTTNFFIAGDGTPEQAGLGALRLFGTASLGGTITLTDNASIVPTNNSTPTITGKITGPGGLRVGHGNGSQGGGTLSISSANDYAGDTTITGPTGGTANVPNAVLKIAAGNNLMPHGLTGSFAGGPTGNLVLDGQVGATIHSAIFDLNGTTQTINGLSSTATAPSNNFVNSSALGAVLILGDSAATANYGGVIQDGAGTVSITKIGAGTQTFSGISTYTGVTTVQGGSLKLAGTGTQGPVLNPINPATGGADVQRGRLQFDYTGGSTVAPQVQTILTNGRPGNFATGAIRSSTADGSHGLGWVDDTINSVVTVAYTYYGDANLDGKVDTLDFNSLAANFGGTNKVWSQADFNYDGKVDTLDFNNLAANFGKTVQFSGEAPGGGGGAGALVPEPGSAALLLLAGAAGTRRRRSRRA